MKKRLLKSLALAVVGSMCAVGAANAAMLEGGLSMMGSYIPMDENGNKTTLLAATGINFDGVVSGDAVDDTFMLTSKTGDFSGITETYGDINDLQFDPFVATGTALWSIGGFEFEMTSLTYRTYSVTTNGITSNSLYIYGLGNLKGNNYDPTPGIWNFSGQDGGGANFSWSASAAASPVPEPATMLLFGSGLIGLAGFRRKLKKGVSPLQKDV